MSGRSLMSGRVFARSGTYLCVRLRGQIGGHCHMYNLEGNGGKSKDGGELSYDVHT